MITVAQDEFIKKFFIQEGYDAVRYQALSEDEKVMFSKDIVGSIVKSIEDREYQLDNQMVNKSKGILKDLDNYRYIEDSLTLLSNMQASLNDKIPYFDIILNAKNNLINFSNDFNRGYKTNKDVVKILYSSLVLSLIESISFLISVSIDYVKDPMGNYQTSLRYNLNRKNQYPTINIENLDNFNKIAKNGDLAHFFTKVYTDKNLQEGMMSDLFIAALTTGNAVFTGMGMVLTAIAYVIPSIPELLRMLVSMSYNTRVELSDYFRLQSYYIEINLERQRNLTNPNKKSIQKQEKIMKAMLKLADKIDLDQKSASKTTQIEIDKQNKNISRSIKEKSVNNTQNGGNSNIEEIIL